MLPTAEQKRVVMMQDKALKDMLTQFSDQRDKMCTSIQKRIEKHFKSINDPQSGLMIFLIQSNISEGMKDNDWAL